MKITMNIDDAILTRLMKNTGMTSKTKAVAHALAEADRRTELKRVLEKGLGLSESELKGAFDDSYDLMALRVAETPGGYGKSAADKTSKPLPQNPVNYAKKRRAR